MIGELFLEGQAIFNFSQLLSYRKGEYDPAPAVERIPDKSVQALVKHMIQMDPAKRASADAYLQWYNPGH